MSKEGKLIKNTIILFLGMIGTKLINIIMLPFYTSWLSLEEYGIIDIFTVIVSIGVPLFTLQLDQAVFRFMIDDHDTDEMTKTISSGLGGLAVSLIVINSLCCLYINISGKLEDFIYLLAINVHCIYTMIQQIARGSGQNSVYAINSAILAFINVSFAILFIRFLNLGAYGYMYAFCIANAIATIILAFQVNLLHFFKVSHIVILKVKKYITYSVPLIINNISWWILNASDKLILNVFCGISANGIFAAAGKIPGLITTVYTVFHLAWQESAAREQSGELSQFYSDVFRKLFAVLSYALIFLLCTLRVSFRVLIDSKFEESYNHIPILLVALCFYCVAQYYGGLFIGAKKTKSLGVSSSIAAAINLFVDLVLVKTIGIYAASISTLVAYFALMIIRFLQTRHYYEIKYHVFELFLCVIMVSISGIAAYFLSLPVTLIILVLITVAYVVMYKDVLNDMAVILKRRMRVKQSGTNP